MSVAAKGSTVRDGAKFILRGDSTRRHWRIDLQFCHRSHPVFKIEVFNALQTRFGPSNAIWPFKIYLSQNNPSKCNPKLKMKTSLDVLKNFTPVKFYTLCGNDWEFMINWPTMMSL
jgi:hypothetical protein